ncbi:hypothetical protein TH53_08240 [Pedobacter lusitanus]|uniref:Uncharacterized protein n=1 Tax=Pedobacter lusitanus TaxID=1503925 RepID=A0A0D0GT15_9SPHI|nr:hypothetical protein TH53_08240 [Pedobacter lusitanus]
MIFIITSAIMIRQSRNFFYLDGTKKRFSILNLEFPSSRSSISILIRQIKKLPVIESKMVFSALRGHLYTDFFFMPGVYVGVLLLCLTASCESSGYISDLFKALAWLQPLAWFCDIIENIYLLGQLKKPIPASARFFIFYRLLEITKWGLSFTGFLLAILQLIYHHL